MLLWGGGGELPFDTKFDPIARGWGTYVRPEHRGKGVSTLLREKGKELLSSLGYRTVVGTVMNDNTPGVQSGEAAGFHLYATQGVLRLRE